jgi:hypothetical protein
MVLTAGHNDTLLSSNYGVTWQIITLPPINVTSVVTAAAISSSGQVITLTTNLGSIYVSSNFGHNFTSISAYSAIDMSNNGEVQIASGVLNSLGNPPIEGKLNALFSMIYIVGSANLDLLVLTSRQRHLRV